MEKSISREEYEELIKEIRELRKSFDELVTTLKPILYLVEKLPDLIVDPAVFKSLAPLLSIPYTLERVNMNVLGALMIGIFEGLSKALEDMATSEKPPKFSMLKLLTDKETKEALGILMEILRKLTPYLKNSIKQYATP
jgi:hypothetical protein